VCGALAVLRGLADAGVQQWTAEKAGKANKSEVDDEFKALETVRCRAK
jgi:hypothetical protein